MKNDFARVQIVEDNIISIFKFYLCNAVATYYAKCNFQIQASYIKISNKPAQKLF